MARRNRNAENPVKAATQRKWSARAWWVSLHIYGYVVLSVRGALSPQAMSTAEFVLTVAVGAATVGCYAILQLSSPGYLEKSAPYTSMQSTGADHEEAVLVATSAPQTAEEDDDAGLLASEMESGRAASESAGGLRYCDECHALQPLRTKHCKDCGRCTRQYDHHCDCVGTCVGEHNRRLFVLYLFLQCLEGAALMSVTSSAFTMQEDVDGWFRANALFIVAWFALLCVLLIIGPLLCYQVFLVSTNQTSWEHARRSSITYLQGLPDDRSPFDRGVLQNWWVFLTGGDRNKWVHAAMPKPTTAVTAEASGASRVMA